MSKNDISFCCPLCGSSEYKEHTENNGIIGPGGRSWITHYECSGCSNHFGDPKKFTIAKKGEKKNSLKHLIR